MRKAKNALLLKLASLLFFLVLLVRFYSDVAEGSKSEALEHVSCVVLRVQERTVERHMVPLYFFLVLLPTFFNAFACSVLTPFGRGKAQQIKKKTGRRPRKNEPRTT